MFAKGANKFYGIVLYELLRTQRRVLQFYFYERLAIARVEISSRSEQKIYGYDLLAPPTYCSRLSRKQRLWQKDGGLSKHLLRKSSCKQV